MTETGRGAWRKTGGALPWYALTPAGTPNVGSHWARFVAAGTPLPNPATPTAYKAVNAAVAAFQRVLNDLQRASLTPDGWLGKGTDTVIKQFQSQRGLVSDGSIGPRTSARMCDHLVAAEAKRIDLPKYALHGLLTFESGYDLGAVGVNGHDTGVGQINLDPTVHGSKITFEQAIDPVFAINWSATNLRYGYDRWRPLAVKSGVDPLLPAIANHNSPLLAKRWATEGEPPYVEGRVIQIEEYVARVLAAGS